jgi:translation initiation factor IF-1
MPKEETIKFKGNVIECLRNAMFVVELENNHTVMATLSGRLRKFNITISSGDIVDVEISSYDLSKGRISYRYKK